MFYVKFENSLNSTKLTYLQYQKQNKTRVWFNETLMQRTVLIISSKALDGMTGKRFVLGGTLNGAICQKKHFFIADQVRFYLLTTKTNDIFFMQKLTYE